MIEIGKISGSVWHRHFSEDSFPNLNNRINNLKVITYLPSNNLYSTYEFILDKLNPSSKFLTVVFGISDIDNEYSIRNIESQIEMIYGTLKNYNFQLNLYVHTRCHIKMLSADDTVYIGTQNISSTSLPLSKLKDRNFNKLFSYHELVIESHDQNQELSKSILRNVIDDKYNCYKAISGGEKVKINFDDLYHWNDYKSILSHITSIEQLIEEVNDFDFDFDLDAGSLTSEIDISLCNNIMDDIVDIYNCRYSNGLVDKIIEFVEWLQDFDLDIDSTIEDRLSSIYLNVKESTSITKVFRKEYEDFIFDLKKLPYDTLLSMAEEIIKLIESNFATSKDSFVNVNESDIMNEISSSIGDYELPLYQDNDGNIPDESIQRAICNDHISLDAQIYAARKHVASLAFSILNIAMTELVENYELYLVDLLEMLRDRLEDERSVFKRIDLE